MTFKAERPDPIKLQEEMRDIAAILNARKIEITQVDQELKSVREEAQSVIAPYNKRIEDLNKERLRLTNEFSDAGNKSQLRMIELFSALIEDQKS